MSAAADVRYGRSPTSSSVVWLTPPEIIEALGPFDLDPCASIGQPWRTATTHYTEPDDGLSQPWEGFVWCNPPYGAGIDRWMARLAEHGHGIALIPARTETKWFQAHVWNHCDGVLFTSGRPRFHYADGSKAVSGIPLPVCLVAFGHDAVRRLLASQIPGCFVTRACIVAPE